MEKKRRPFQGVLNILSFNRHYYFFGLAFMAILFGSRFIIEWNNVIFWIVIASFLYGLIIPLVVSAYVYDFSGYYKMDWLQKLISDSSNNSSIVNINAGFDETSFLLERKFSGAN